MGERTKLGLGILGAAGVLGLLGDLLLRATPWGLNVALWAAALVLAVAALAGWRGVALSGEGRWLAVPVMLFAALFAWRDSNTLAVVNGLAALAALSLGAPRARSGRLVPAGLSEYLYLGLQAFGYACAGPLPAAVRDVRWREMHGVGYGPAFAVLRGLALAAPLLLLFGGLFVAADAIFEGLVTDFLDFDFGEVFGHALLFGVFFWACAGLLRVVLAGGELPGSASFGERPRFLYLGAVEVGVVFGLLDALFLMFVAVQVRYLFGGDGVVLSGTGLTYAEYARRGFFELVAVVAFALPLLLAAHSLLSPDRPRAPRVFRPLAGLLVVLLFVVVASALQRMRLYTAEYGLTELRLYTTGFMLWISLVLVWFVLDVLLGGRRYFAAGTFASGLLAVLLLNALNPDALIVTANVARLQDGQRFDAPYLTSLSADAVPPLAAALPEMNDADRSFVAGQLRLRWPEGERDWRTYNVSRSRAFAEDYSGRADRAAPGARAAEPEKASSPRSQGSVFDRG